MLEFDPDGYSERLATHEALSLRDVRQRYYVAQWKQDPKCRQCGDALRAEDQSPPSPQTEPQSTTVESFRGTPSLNK